LIAKSQTAAVQAASSGGFFPCLLLSGFVYPLSNIPFPLSLVSYLVPARYYIDVSRNTFMRGTGWEVLIQDSLPLAGFVVALMGICWFLLKDMRLKD
jgi:ABC-2 type transport system permease protein